MFRTDKHGLNTGKEFINEGLSFLAPLPKINIVYGKPNVKERTISAGHTAESSILLDLVLASLDKDKAQDIITIPLAGKSTIADFMVIASGTSSRQLMSMADHLERNLKDAGNRPMGSEGGNTGDWILIDAGDVIVHLFRPEVREIYQLEKMWADHGGGETVTIQSATV